MDSKLITVCIVNNGSKFMLDRTLESLEKQTSSCFTYKVVEQDEFWNKNRNQIYFDTRYVMYLYSGSVLDKKGIEEIDKFLRGEKPQWMYFDEKTYDAELNADNHGFFEKPDFSEYAFLQSVYIGEAVIFSKEILAQMHLNYEKNNFLVALLEMGIAAAAKADPLHLKKCLLVRHNRREASAIELKLITTALKDYVKERELPILIVPKEKGVGVSIYPAKKNECKISVILITEEEKRENLSNVLGEEIELIISCGNRPYHEKCMLGAQKASGDVLCFVDRTCEIANRDIINNLADFIKLPNVGMVSPCLYDEKTLIYTGAYDQSGKIYKVSKDDEEMNDCLEDIFSVRETLAPAWQFWMMHKDQVWQVFENTKHEFDRKDISKEIWIKEVAIQLKKNAKHALYVGNIITRCEMCESIEAPDNFVELLFEENELYFIDPYCPITLHNIFRGKKEDNTKFYFPTKVEISRKNGKKVYVLTHELSLTGAPIVLTHAVRILKKEGWDVLIVSPEDGVLRDTFLKEGFPVMIQGNMDESTEWINVAKKFNLVIVNTIVPFKQIEQLRDLEIPVLWWLHDAKSGYEDYLQFVLPDTIGENIHVYSVSQYADDAVREFRPKYKTNLLLYGLKDEAINCQDEYEIPDLNGRFLFVNVGTVIRRKGQDIMAKAVRLLPENIRKQCLFLFVGRCIDKDIFKFVKDLEEDFPEEVRQIDAISHDDIFKLYKQATAVVCSSRDDPLPTFMSETMMVSGVCICSENTGTAAVIQNGINGYVYKNDSPAELAQCIRQLIECKNTELLKVESRKTFEKIFSMEIFEKNLLNCVLECIGEEGEKKNE